MLRLLLSGLILLGGGVSAVAQTLQLPTLRSFGYRGTVVVPDRGAASLGGNATATARSQRSGLGAFGSRGAAVGGGATNASVHAYVIDLQEWDRRVLGYDPLARRRFAGTGGAGDGTKRIASQPLPSRTELGKRYVRTARGHAKEGRYRLAGMYYDMAVRHLSGELASLARQEQERMVTHRMPSAAVDATD